MLKAGLRWFVRMRKVVMPLQFINFGLTGTRQLLMPLTTDPDCCCVSEPTSYCRNFIPDGEGCVVTVGTTPTKLNYRVSTFCLAPGNVAHYGLRQLIGTDVVAGQYASTAWHAPFINGALGCTSVRRFRCDEAIGDVGQYGADNSCPPTWVQHPYTTGTDTVYETSISLLPTPASYVRFIMSTISIGTLTPPSTPAAPLGWSHSGWKTQAGIAGYFPVLQTYYNAVYYLRYPSGLVPAGTQDFRQVWEWLKTDVVQLEIPNYLNSYGGPTMMPDIDLGFPGYNNPSQSFFSPPHPFAGLYAGSSQFVPGQDDYCLSAYRTSHVGPFGVFGESLVDWNGKVIPNYNGPQYPGLPPRSIEDIYEPEVTTIYRVSFNESPPPNNFTGNCVPV